MNCLIFVSLSAALVSMLLGPDTCQAEPNSACVLEDCSTDCSEIGALRWSCEEYGCMCTFLLDDAKALEQGDELEGESKEGHNEQSSKDTDSAGKDQGSSGDGKESTGKDKGSPQNDVTTSNATLTPAQNGSQGWPSNTARNKKSGQDSAQNKRSRNKASGKRTKRPGGRTTEGEGNDGDKLSLLGNDETSKKPDSKDANDDDTGQEDGKSNKEENLGGISLLSRQALEPDSGGKGKRKGNVRGRAGAEGSSMHMPFLVKSLTRPLSKQQVMEQIKKQKGDIPMKEIEEFIMKG